MKTKWPSKEIQTKKDKMNNINKMLAMIKKYRMKITKKNKTMKQIKNNDLLFVFITLKMSVQIIIFSRNYQY